jgi:hypothetical protein
MEPEDNAEEFNFLLEGEGRLRTARSAGNFDAIYGGVDPMRARAEGDLSGLAGKVEGEDEAGEDDDDVEYDDDYEGVDIVLNPIDGSLLGQVGLQADKSADAAASAAAGAAAGAAAAAGGDENVGGFKWNSYVRDGAPASATDLEAAVKSGLLLRATIAGHVPGGIESLAATPTDAAIELDLDALASKPWREPGADITEYFNYGFTEETWRMYCRRQFEIRFDPRARAGGSGGGGGGGGGGTKAHNRRDGGGAIAEAPADVGFDGAMAHAPATDGEWSEQQQPRGGGAAGGRSGLSRKQQQQQQQAMSWTSTRPCACVCESGLALSRALSLLVPFL